MARHYCPTDSELLISERLRQLLPAALAQIDEPERETKEATEFWRTATEYMAREAVGSYTGGLDTADITQSAVIAAYRSLGSIGIDRETGIRKPAEEIGVAAWLWVVARNTRISRVRQHTSQQKPLVSDPHSILETAEVDSGLDGTETMEDLHNVLDQIDPEFSRVFMLREIDDLSYQEITERTGVPLNTVRSRLRRARKEIGEALGGDYLNN